jgi:hypothetical protein
MRSRLGLFVLLGVALSPHSAWAQASITGTVRDASGAVLPGVTVEATSPALTEKVRSAITDGSGQFRIVDLRPGTYSVTFTLPGFSTVKREGIELAGEFVATINTELKVGALEESITVTSESPVVDLQTARRENVFNADVVAALPATRAYGSLLNVTPGLTVDGNGLAATPTMTFFSARGGQTNEGRVNINGMVVAAAFNGGGVSSLTYDSVNVDEVSVVVSGGLGEQDIGGPVMNLVPRSGGNQFRGQAFLNNAGDWSKGDNLNDELRAVGIRQTPGIISSYDASGSYGGPIKRDRVWFFGSYRKLDTATAVEGIVANANAGNAARWDWAPVNGLAARQLQGREMIIGRLTAQVTPKNRIQFNHEYQTRCEGSPLRVETPGCHTRDADWIGLGSANQSPEAATTGGYFDFPYYVTQALWTSPVTSKLLFEAGLTRFSYYHAGGPGQPAPDADLSLISVTEQSAAVNAATGIQYAPRTNYVYRGIATYQSNYGNPNNWRASASYVTGAHNMKVGYQGSHLRADSQFISPVDVSYRFNQGVPNQFTFRIPNWRQSDRTRTASLYAQDTWTRGRMTLQAALRYDRAWSFSPAEGNGTDDASRLNTAIRFDKTIGVDAFNDLTPRFGFAYDLFGTGKTAIKANFGHYLDAATNDSAYTRNNQALRVVRTVARNWTDTNGNRAIDCDLLNFAAQSAVDTCGALTGENLNFGRPTGATIVDPNTLRGWGVRENDWQWGVTLQHEILPRVSMDVSYNRRWWRGFTVTDNLNRDPSQYQLWTINAPLDSRLPGGGGYPITMYTETAAAAAIPALNQVRFETDFGPRRTNYWQGVDVNVTSRMRNGLMVQAGTSTGRAITNTCETVVKIDSPNPRNCNNVFPFQTTLRGLASYTVPKIDVAVSATMRSQPQLERVANWNVPNTVVQSLLGRLPPGAVAGGVTTINILDTENRLFSGERRTQIDMRFAKIVRFNNLRADIGVDLGNLLNANYATAFENTYQYSDGNTLRGGTWNNPTAIYNPRFARLNFTVNF